MSVQSKIAAWVLARGRVSRLVVGVWLSCLVLTCSTVLSQTAPPLVPYIYAPVRLGAGGYVTGLVKHPANGEIAYCRTDVGGAYRWNAKAKSWDQLVSETGFPDQVGVEFSDVGVESIAIAPNQPQRVYIAVFDSVYVSDNRGNSFRKVGPAFDLQPNNPNLWRVMGERLVVDPKNANRVLFGSRNEGLWYSESEGNWQRSNLPRGDVDCGISSVAFAPANTTAGTTPTPAYAGVVGRGVFRSIDGGRTWQTLHAGPGSPPTAVEPSDLEFASDGTLVVVFANGTERGRPPGSIWKYRPGARWGVAASDWKNITPTEVPWGENYYSVAVDPFNPQRWIVSQFGFKVAAITQNGGNTWQTLVEGWDPIFRNTGEILWQGKTEMGWFEHGDLLFDTTVRDRLWVAGGSGVWFTDGVNQQIATSDRLDWRLESRGIEELVARDMESTQNYRPLFVTMDFTAFQVFNPNRYNARRIVEGTLEDGWDLAVNPWNEAVQVMSAYKFGINYSKMSRDGGTTWNLFPSIENQSHPENLNHGAIAINQGTGGAEHHLVWAPSDNSPPFFSHDNGATWNRPQGWPNGSDGAPMVTGMWSQWFMAQTLTADPTRAGRFLMYLKHDGGVLIESLDGGRNWQVLNRDLPMWGHHAKLLAVPRRPGQFWFASSRAADPNGLWRSQDGGATFSRVEIFSEAISVAVGRRANTSPHLTIFVLGKIGNTTGVFRSIDNGETWVTVMTGNGLRLLDQPVVLGADHYWFGRFYVGLGGTGFMMGAPNHVLSRAAQALIDMRDDASEVVMRPLRQLERWKSEQELPLAEEKVED